MLASLLKQGPLQMGRQSMSKGTRVWLGVTSVLVGVVVSYVGAVGTDIVPVVLGFVLAGLGAMFTLGQVGEA